MLTLTRKSDYALVALAYLARQAGRPGGGAVSARRIADDCHLPHPLLTNILKELAHQGVVESVRGVQGGYKLAQAAERISLLRVVSALEGPVRLVQCASPALQNPQNPESRDARDSSEEASCCRLMEACPIGQPIRRLNERLRAFLAGVSLADLLEAKVDVPVELVHA